MVELAGGAVAAASAARRASTSPAPRPVPTERNAKSSTPRATPCHCSPSAARLMSFSSVTASPRRRPQLGAEQRRPRGSRTCWSRLSRPLGIDDAGHADDGAVDRARGSASVASSSDDVTDSIAATPPRRRRRASSTSWRARIVAGEVADRAAQRSARRGRGRARAPPRGRARRRPRRSSARRGRCSASRTSPASSSDCSASETVGFEMPARREISAREIGAPARIASSTVRSFRCLSSGGVARLGVVVRHLVRNPNGK